MSKGIKVHVRWMPSHIKVDEPRPDDVSLDDIYGNDFADQQAKIAAKGHALPLSVTARAVYYHKLISRIQLRLISVAINLPNRPHRAKQAFPRVVGDPIDSLIAKSEHVIHRSNNRISCLRCCNSFAIKDSGVKPFLAQKCNAMGSDKDQPVPVPLEVKHIGNKSTHVSHKLSMFRGLVFCAKCGMRGPTKLVNLSKPCLEPNEYGSMNLEAKSNRRLPEGMDYWPDEESTVSQKIDKATKVRHSDLPDSFHGLRIKRPKSVFNEAGLSTSTPFCAGNVTPIGCRAESFLPPELLNLIELASLEASGVQVQWPDGIVIKVAHAIIFDFFSPMIERDEVNDECLRINNSPQRENAHASSSDEGFFRVLR